MNSQTALNPEQVAQLTRLKQYFPFRIICGALNPLGEFRALAVPTMREPNKLAREGWKVWRVE